MGEADFDVFLSYSSSDEAWVRRLKAALEVRGLSVWLDREQIRPGDRFVEALEHGIDSSHSVVLVVSSQAQASGWVREEHDRAIRLSNDRGRQLRLVPVLLGGAEPQGFLASRQWVDFRAESCFEESVDRLYWGITGKRPTAGPGRGPRGGSDSPETAAHSALPVPSTARLVGRDRDLEWRVDSPQTQDAVLDRYARHLRHDLQSHLVLELYDIRRVEALCVDPLFAEVGGRAGGQRPLTLAEIGQHPRVGIIGEPGSGKTTALKLLALQFLREGPLEHLPVYVRLAYCAPPLEGAGLPDFGAYIDRELAVLGGPTLAALLQMEGIRPVLLLDGWDEMQSDEAVRLVKTFLANTTVDFVVSARPEAYSPLPYCAEFEILQLDDDDTIQQFVYRRFRDWDRVQEFWQWVSSDPGTAELAKLPLYLSMMAIVFQGESETARLTRTELYQKSFEAILRQHHRARRHEYEIVAEGAKDVAGDLARLLQHLAFRTLSEGRRVFGLPALEAAARETMGGVPAGLVKLIAGRLGIIRDRRAGRFDFFHPWYQEFLAARHIVESGLDAASLLHGQRLVGLLPYLAGLLHSPGDAVKLLRDTPVDDVFTFCRSVAEIKALDSELRGLLLIAMCAAEQRKLPVRVCLACALARAGLRSVPSLISIARDPSAGDYARRAAVEALALLVPEAHLEFRQLLLELLEAAEDGLLWHVVERVGYLRPAGAREALERYRESDDPILAGDALWAAGRLRGEAPDAIPESLRDGLLSALESGTRHTRGHALRTIGRLRLHTAIPRLEAYLLDACNPFRWIAAEAACLIGGVEAARLLPRVLADHEVQVQATALQTLHYIPAALPYNVLDSVRALQESGDVVESIGDTIGRVASVALARVGLSPRGGVERGIYIARHGQTEWNRSGRLQGRKDLPLSEEGYREARGYAEVVRALSPVRLFASPAKRAQETAAVYADLLGLPLATDERFGELDHGVWEGQVLVDLLGTAGTGYGAWYESPGAVPIPGGTETVAAAARRFLLAARELCRQSGPAVPLIISHKHVMALFLCLVYDLPLAEFRYMIIEDVRPYYVPGRHVRAAAERCGLE
jgi:broad specificity phosphatase PhoE